MVLIQSRFEANDNTLRRMHEIYDIRNIIKAKSLSNMFKGDSRLSSLAYEPNITE